MKNLVPLLLVCTLLCIDKCITAQDVAIRKEIQYIDSVLYKNPYFEKFLGITYYYSLDITENKELVVKMDFKGPFTSTCTVRLTDLEHPFDADTTEYTSALIWRCKQESQEKTDRCVRQENLYTNGDRETVDSEDISIMLPSETRLRLGLIKSIDELIKKVLE